MFASQYAAYESLSSVLRQVLDGLGAVHEHEALTRKYEMLELLARPTVHPAVRTHPERDARCLFVNACYTTRFDGMTVAESAGLLSFLTTHATSPDFCYRHRWSVGDLVVWDNRCTQHYAVHDYGDSERLLYRAAIAGDRPF
jgi:taurine dioxygenase